MSILLSYHFNFTRRIGQAPALARWTLVLVAGGLLAMSGSAPAAGTSADAIHEIASPVNGTTDLEEKLRELLEKLRQAEQTINGQAGPLSDPDRSDVLDTLDAAEAILDQIRDPQQSPTLSPSDAGDPDLFTPYFNLPSLADLCETYADDARIEAETSSPDHYIIGSHMKSVRTRLQSYRNLVEGK